MRTRELQKGIWQGIPGVRCARLRQPVMSLAGLALRIHTSTAKATELKPKPNPLRNTGLDTGPWPGWTLAARWLSQFRVTFPDGG